MRTQRLSSRLLAAGKLCRVFLLNLSRCANVNTVNTVNKCSVSVRSTSHLLIGMLVLPRMPLLVLLLLCLLLQSFAALRIFWVEMAFCVFLC